MNCNGIHNISNVHLHYNNIMCRSYYATCDFKPCLLKDDKIIYFSFNRNVVPTDLGFIRFNVSHGLFQVYPVVAWHLVFHNNVT